MTSAKIDSGLFRNPNRDLYVNTTGKKKPELDDYGYPKPRSWWTGQPPVEGCPGYDAGIIHSLPLPDISSTGTRQGLLDYFDNTWTLTEVLFSGLLGKDVFQRAPWHQLRHPMIFYYGHVACVYINKLRVAGLLDQGLDAYLEEIMETGVDEMSWDDLGKNDMDWPDVARVTEYRRQVYSVVKGAILNGPISFPIRAEDPAWALVMGFEHERIHLETSSVLIRELPLHLVTRPAQFPPPHPSAGDPGAGGRGVANGLVAVAGGTVELGKPGDWPSFGWDNEYGRRSVEVGDFQATRYLITNAEFLDFVKAGGYLAERWWTAAGWQWRAFRNVLFPTFWVPDGPVGLHRYRLRTAFDAVPLPAAWPACVNAHEARAYCAWRTARDKPAHPYRLLTEAEHHCTRDASARAPGAARRDAALLHGGADIALPRAADGAGAAGRYNLQLAWGSESPVDALPAASSGLCDAQGNVWTWCEDDFNPLEGFAVSPLYADFSTPCFDGLHTMIMGGSFISTGDEASVFARFHFRPHFHQHAGFRMVTAPTCRATVLPKHGTNGASAAPRPGAEAAAPGGEAAPGRGAAGEAEEGDERVNEHMLFHYGARMDVLPWDAGPAAALAFPSRAARKVTEWVGRLGVATGRALDLGCAVGGSTFELAAAFDEVVGLDPSPAFIAAALEMKDAGQRGYARKEEGDVRTELVASVDCLVDRKRVHFAVADACALAAEDYGEFDAVLVGNLVCRVADPSACLAAMAGLVRPAGLLVVTSTGSWREEVTPRARWLGGYTDSDGAHVRTIDGIRRCLEGDFELVHREDMPLLVREHARQFRWAVADASVWRRRGAA